MFFFVSGTIHSVVWVPFASNITTAKSKKNEKDFLISAWFAICYHTSEFYLSSLWGIHSHSDEITTIYLFFFLPSPPPSQSIIKKERKEERQKEAELWAGLSSITNVQRASSKYLNISNINLMSKRSVFSFSRRTLKRCSLRTAAPMQTQEYWVHFDNTHIGMCALEAWKKMKWLLNGWAFINQRGLSIYYVLFPLGVFATCRPGLWQKELWHYTNKYWFEYMGLSQLCIIVIGWGVIESGQIVIWVN